jgi:hypothetical protein
MFSMYGYFRAFFRGVIWREEPSEKTAPAAAVRYHEQ